MRFILMKADIKKLLIETPSIHKKKGLNRILIAIFKEYGYIPDCYIPAILSKISTGDIFAYFNRLRYSLNPKLEYDRGIAGRRKTRKNNNMQEAKKKARRMNSVRDYSKPALSDLINEARTSNGTKKPQQWMKIVSVPMGGMNRR